MISGPVVRLLAAGLLLAVIAVTGSTGIGYVIAAHPTTHGLAIAISAGAALAAAVATVIYNLIVGR